MQHARIVWRLRKSNATNQAAYFRALVAAYYLAPKFAERVSWRAVETLQTLGLLELGAIKLTTAGQRFIELAVEEPWFMHGWSEARTELQSSELVKP